MPVTCRSCVPLDCPDQSVFDYYTIDGPSFNFVLNCPPGFTCDHSDFFQMECCGDLYGAYLYGDDTQKEAIRASIVERCIQRRMFCGGGGEDPNSPFTFFFNRPRRADLPCPDGSFFTYWVPAGIVAGQSQASADSLAYSLAIALANQHKICLASTIPRKFCANSAFNFTITASGGGVLSSGNEWSLVSGALPTGLTFSTSDNPLITLNGVPTVGGSYTFTVQFLTTKGDFKRKTFTICIVDIHPSSLPSGTQGTAYNQTITTDSCAVAPISFQLLGPLPDGLSLDEETGIISGTPTTIGTFNFAIRVQDEAT